MERTELQWAWGCGMITNSSFNIAIGVKQLKRRDWKLEQVLQ